MNDRDHFAAAALTGLLADPQERGVDVGVWACVAYELADAMLRERERTADPTLDVCPYITGTVTRYCTLTPFTLTDAEREALRFCIRASLPEAEKLGGVAGELCRMHSDRLRGLLERLG